ncbi:prepilin peptidase [Anaerobacillus alkaliphilus]|uniref:Prepilin peptidase n=1 Tax=Anaerobacillus alkaliphilus TaxID=1548597 RepID=A0A4Q0VPS8_9BACI|nr:A24 family peptidase [Anaerobacillus alkaliphilus]RXI98413.1 prepilin peptidase [Anaerobacillus alkaliphilus]
MEIILHIYLFLLGLILGSFYNVVGLRIPKGQSILKPPSHCPSCNERLRFIDLFPVFSYLAFRGKCRHCKTRISPIYPVFELTTGILFAISPIFVGWSFELLIALLLISLLIIIFVSDLHYMIIPDRVLLFFLPLFILGRVLGPMDPWWSPIAGAFVGFFLLYAIAVVSKGGMGGGDIKLFGVLGIALGLQATLLTLFFAAFLGSIVGLVGILLKKVKRGKPIPFGPFIAVGALIAYFFGQEVIGWYLTLLTFS